MNMNLRDLVTCPVVTLLVSRGAGFKLRVFSSRIHVLNHHVIYSSPHSFYKEALKFHDLPGLALRDGDTVMFMTQPRLQRLEANGVERAPSRAIAHSPACAVMEERHRLVSSGAVMEGFQSKGTWTEWWQDGNKGMWIKQWTKHVQRPRGEIPLGKGMRQICFEAKCLPVHLSSQWRWNIQLA